MTYTSRDHALGSPNEERYIIRHDELVEDQHAPHCALKLWDWEYVTVTRRGRDVTIQADSVEVRYIKPGRDTGK